MGPDLLKVRFLARLAASRFYPKAARIFTLIVFLLLIAGGFAVPHVSADMTGTLRNTNLASLIVWSLWWPLVIASAVILGRVWCQVCPMELVNTAFSRIGRKKRVPRFLASGWGTALFYALALLGFIRTFWAHRYPERMSIFFLFLFASAIAAGLLYEKRAFCTYLCPVGRILGLYACGAVLEWRVRDPGICAVCRAKGCVAATGEPTAGCPSGLVPAAIADNRDCLVCTECRKACPSGNFRLSLRRPLADFFSGFRLRTVDLFLLLPVFGLVIWELGEEWSPARKALEAVPAAVNAALGFSGDAGQFVQAVILFLVLPALLVLIPAAAGKPGSGSTLLESARTFGLLILPLAAFGHLVKAAIRIASRLPYYAPAFRDPAGLETARAIAAGSLQIDKGIVTAVSPGVSIFAALVLAFAVFSVGMISRKSPALRTFGKAGRRILWAFGTLYGLALLAIVVLARF
jgi:hypothetical protein